MGTAYGTLDVIEEVETALCLSGVIFDSVLFGSFNLYLSGVDFSSSFYVLYLAIVSDFCWRMLLSFASIALAFVSFYFSMNWRIEVVVVDFLGLFLKLGDRITDSSDEDSEKSLSCSLFWGFRLGTSSILSVLTRLSTFFCGFTLFLSSKFY